MHIPKTSGMALTSALVSALDPAVMVAGHDRSLFGSFRDFDSIDLLRCGIHDSAAVLPKEADLVAGHIALSTLRDAYPLARRLTLLREPTTRLLSHWLFWRQHTDAELAIWGKWANRVTLARQPLETFLRETSLACQTDNLTLRMLLWPHPLIQGDQFIDPAFDRQLVDEAATRLDSFDFVDVVEDAALTHRLWAWLGHSVVYRRHNETRAIPQQWRSALHRELTPEAYDLLDARSRLDLLLWHEVAGRRLPGCDLAKLRERTILTHVARYGALMG